MPQRRQWCCARKGGGCREGRGRYAAPEAAERGAAHEAGVGGVVLHPRLFARAGGDPPPPNEDCAAAADALEEVPPRRAKGVHKFAGLVFERALVCGVGDVGVCAVGDF